MDQLLQGVRNRQNVIFTVLGGFKRTQFLLRAGLTALFRSDQQTSINKILHIVIWDENVTRTFNYAKILPYEEFDLKVAKRYDSENETNKSDPIDYIRSADVIICSSKFVLDLNTLHESGLALQNILVIFDGVPLESIENTCCELNQPQPGAVNLPGIVFGRLSRSCWSVIIGCNKSDRGIEHELGCKFPIKLHHDTCDLNADYRVFSGILKQGPQKDLTFGLHKRRDLHDDVGQILETSSRLLDSGGIVVFFSSYGEMIEYHSKWKTSGLFDRIGVPYERENRGEGQFKRMLVNFCKRTDKNIVLISHRFHQNINLGDFALSFAARLVISVGLPYPFTNDNWSARMQLKPADETALVGDQLFNYRAMESMGGLVRRCLDEVRYKDCAFLILDQSMAAERDNMIQELSDYRDETFSQCMERLRIFFTSTGQ